MSDFGSFTHTWVCIKLKAALKKESATLCRIFIVLYFFGLEIASRASMLAFMLRLLLAFGCNVSCKSLPIVVVSGLASVTGLSLEKVICAVALHVVSAALLLWLSIQL